MHFLEYVKNLYYRFGFLAQTLIMIEEMAELTKAIIKIHRYGKDAFNEKSGKFYYDEFIEEMADVYITWNTLVKGEDIEKSINEVVNRKMERDYRRYNL